MVMCTFPAWAAAEGLVIPPQFETNQNIVHQPSQQDTQVEMFVWQQVEDVRMGCVYLEVYIMGESV